MYTIDFYIRYIIQTTVWRYEMQVAFIYRIIGKSDIYTLESHNYCAWH